MTESKIFDVLFTGMQPALWAAIGVFAFRLLLHLDSDRDRRSANPSLRGGMALFGFAAFGLSLLALRMLVFVIDPSWVARINIPGSLVRAATTTMLVLLTYGAFLIQRGIKAVLYPAKDGGMPALPLAIIAPIAIVALTAVSRLEWP